MGEDPPASSGTEPSVVPLSGFLRQRQGGWSPSTSLDQPHLPTSDQVASVVRTPFGLVRMWEDGGRTFLAEASSDGALLGPAIALAGNDGPARGASAAVHSHDAGFFLTVTWLGGGRDGATELLMQSWHLGRGASGLSLRAANDNPIVITPNAAEAGLASLPGDDLLLTWVDPANGEVWGQVRQPAGESAQVPSFQLGQSVLDPQLSSRRVQVAEIAPLEFAVFWLAASRHEIAAARLGKALEDGETGPATWVVQALPSIPLDAKVSGAFAVVADVHGHGIGVIYESSGADGATSVVKQSISLPQGEAAGAAPGSPGLSAPLSGADDFGFLWASHDLLHLAPSALHAPDAAAAKAGPLVTQADEPLLIDLAAHGAPHHVKIVSVDGVPLASDGPTRIAGGWLQARGDGHLTFTPDVDAVGHMRFALAGIGEAGAAWHHHVDVHVEGLYETAAVHLRNPVKAIPAHAVVAHNAQMAEIGFAGMAPPHGAVSLAGVDADKFVVIGNGLFLRGGTRLEPGRKALDVSVHYKDGLAGAAIAASLTVAVLNDPAAFLSLALPARAHAAEINAGALVAEIGVVDQPLGGDRVSLSLLSNAGGRFALSGGNLVVASPQLFAHDPEATYDVVVRTAKPNGIALDHKITLHHEDVLGRPPMPADKGPAASPEAKGPEAGTAPAVDGADAALLAAPKVPVADAAPGEGAEPGPEGTILSHAEAGTEALPPLHVDASTAAPATKGSSSQPDLGSSSSPGRPSEESGLSKVLAQQHDDTVGQQSGRETRGGGSGRDDNRGSSHESSHEKDLIEALRSLDRSSGEGNRGSSGHGSELEKAQAAVSGDTLFFKPGFGKETIEHVKLSGGEAHDVLDLSLYGTTFEALRAAGAFEQVGNDVVVTLNPSDPAHSDQIVLKSIDLHQIDPGDFKFS